MRDLYIKADAHVGPSAFIMLLQFAIEQCRVGYLIICNMHLTHFVVAHEFENPIIEIGSDFLEENPFKSGFLRKCEIDAETVAVFDQVCTDAFFKHAINFIFDRAIDRDDMEVNEM